MKLTRLVCILLCMMLVLCACEEAPAPTTAPTQPSVTTTPTQPPLDPVALYADAVAVLEESDSYSLTVTRVKTVQVATETFTEDYQQTITRSGDIVKTAGTINFSATQVFTNELWADGTAYLNLNGSLFSAPMELDGFLDRYAPVQLFTPENYGSVTAEEGDSIAISFFDATAAESWLAPEAASLVSAAGTATVTADGTLTGCTYDLTYSYGGVTVTEDWDITCSDVKTAPEAPENAESYLAVESIDAPLLLEQGKAHLAASKSVSASGFQLITSQAAGYGCEMRLQANHTDGMYRFENHVTEISEGQTQSYELDEIYRDGKYTMSVDGEEPEEVAGVNTKVLDVYVRQQLVDPIYGADTVGSCVVTEIGSVLLAEFTGNDAWCKAVRGQICGTILTNPTALDVMATAIEDGTREFYIAIDKYTGLPTAYGYNYECTHTIQGGQYLLKGTNDIAYDIASLSAYENITEEPAPDAEVEGPTPLLYKVTGENGQQMWLFGTIHVGDDRTGHLPQALTDALLSSDALAVECDTDGFEAKLEEDSKLAQKVSEAYYYSDGSTAKDHFTDSELYDSALKMMKASGNYSYSTEYMKPFLWKSAIDNFYMLQGHQLSSEKGLESRLEKLAADNDIPLWEVESVMLQLDMMAGWSQELNEEMLRELLVSDGVAYARDLQELYDLWCSGDEEALIDMIREDTSEMDAEELALYEEYNKSISSDRNVGMLEVAKDYLESGDVVFYAVGLAHLLAEDGLVFTLRDAGYTVELVTFE